LTRAAIPGLRAHSQAEELRSYDAEAPDGTWIGRLDHLAWGLSSNLLCYFTDEGSGLKHRLSVFSRQGYRPYEAGPAFDEEALGGRYEIRTARSGAGWPKFLAASKLEKRDSRAHIL